MCFAGCGAAWRCEGMGGVGRGWSEARDYKTQMVILVMKSVVVAMKLVVVVVV